MIHRAGIGIFIILLALLLAINTLVIYLDMHIYGRWVVQGASVLLIAFILNFFRKPKRIPAFIEGDIYAPADGRVVVIEKTHEREYLQEERIQVSIFMSVWDVHINWYPCAGKITYIRHHPGKYLVARHPKSSELNERNTLVVRNGQGTEILVRQIAGAVARRIISYSEGGQTILPGDEMGFIRFGSRVDLFLPADSQILVKCGQKVRGLQHPLARLK
jgi:phosphatidylserine decarboxylase